MRLKYWMLAFYEKGLIIESNDVQQIKVMKRLIDLVVGFLKKEWFLLIAVSTIALIILVFELL